MFNQQHILSFQSFQDKCKQDQIKMNQQNVTYSKLYNVLTKKNLQLRQSTPKLYKTNADMFIDFILGSERERLHLISQSVFQP